MKRNNTEEQIQIALFEHVRLRAVPGAVIYHVPNGGLRHKVLAARLKKMGVLPGIPDVEALWKGNKYYLELKAPGNYPTPDQVLRMQELQSQGAIVYCATGLDQALQKMEEWGLLTGTAASVRIRERPEPRPRSAPPSIYDHDFWSAG